MHNAYRIRLIPLKSAPEPVGFQISATAMSIAYRDITFMAGT